jgi:hypothetical protein
MKIKIPFFLLLFLLVAACQKDKLPTNSQSPYYQSKGNFLILQVSDTLEGIYEYNLPVTTLQNDSLPLVWSHFDDGIQVTSHLQFSPNVDTLLRIIDKNFSFSSPFVNAKSLKVCAGAEVPNLSDFQFLGGPIQINPQQIWTQIALLDIVQKYRASKPNAKIAICRIVNYIYNSEFGLSLPQEKFLIFIVG